MTNFQLASIAVFVGLAAIAILAYFGRLPGQRQRDDTGRELKALLRDRAEGKIDEAQFQALQAALHEQLMTPAAPAAPAQGIAGRIMVIAIPLAIVAAAGGIYAWLGDRYPSDVKPGSLATAPITAQGRAQISPLVSSIAPSPSTTPVPGAAQPGSAGDMNAMVTQLAQKLEKDASNGEGWLLLARAYGELRRPGDAAKAYARAAALLPPDASMLANWADAHVLANDRKWDDEARAIVKRSLAADPKHLKALALAGSEAFDRAGYKEAIDYWERMRAAAPPESMDAKLAEANIEAAKARASGAQGANSAPAAQATPLASKK